MVSDIEENSNNEEWMDRRVAYLDTFDVEGAAIVTGLSKAALLRNANNRSHGSSVAVPDVRPSDVTVAAGTDRIVPPHPFSDTDAPAAPGPSTSIREVPAMEQHYAFTIDIGGHVIGVQDGTSAVSSRIFSMALDAVMDEEIEDFRIYLDGLDARAAALLVGDGAALLKELYERRPVAFFAEGIMLRPKTVAAAERFLSAFVAPAMEQRA